MILLLFFPIFGKSSDSVIGKQAPLFSVQSNNNESLDLDALEGRIGFIVYKSRKSIKKNSDFKDRLNDIYNAQPHYVRQAIVRVPIIDLSDTS